MNQAQQAEIAAEPASAPETPAAPTPSPAQAATTPAETQPSPSSEDPVDAILFGGAPAAESKPETAPVATTTEAAPVATDKPAPTESVPAAEVPAGSTPQATDAPATPETPASDAPTEPAEKILPNRISTDQFNPEEQRALALKHKYDRAGNPITVKEAFELLDRQDQQASAAAATAAQEAESAPDPVSVLDQEVAEIRTKLKEAGENGSLMTSEIADLTIALADKSSDLKIAKLQQQQQQSANQAAAAAAAVDRFAPSKEAAYRDYPEAQVEDSRLNLLAAAVLSAWQSPNHPNHALLSQEDAPMLVVRHAAEKLGIAPAGSQPVPAKPAATVAQAVTAPAQPTPAAGKVLTAPGSATIGAPPAAPSMRDLLKRTLPGSRVDTDKVLFPE